MSVKGTNGTAVGGTADNLVSGIGGETVTYTMQVTNESQSEEGITNLTIINRLPYEGDERSAYFGSAPNREIRGYIQGRLERLLYRRLRQWN